MLLGTVVCIFQDLTHVVFGGGAEDVEQPAQQHPRNGHQGLRHHRQHHRASAAWLPSLTQGALPRLSPISSK
jgi:hypothetical protein